MKIGIYGGTFDPPHIGHVNGAVAAVKSLKLDVLFIIPAGIPPHKALRENSSSAQERYHMTELAMRGIDKAKVTNIEILREGESFTVDTIHEIRMSYPKAKLFIIMGTDMVMSFETWKSYTEIMAECTLCAFSRRKGENADIEAKLASFEKLYGAETSIIYLDVVDISSSQIRDMLPKRRGNEYLTDSVYSYIIRKRLYGAKPNFEWLRKKAYAMLKPRRVNHVKGCEMEAARLAEHWGEDVEDAREAAILHDVTKKEDLEGQLKICRRYGVVLDEEERHSPNLLHSKTGAAIAKNVFGCSDKVANAIKWHTTGKENMTKLEKIIYLADFIEPTRSFEGLEDVRRVAYKNLNKAVEMAFVLSLEDMERRGVSPHVQTIMALNSIREEQRIEDLDDEIFWQ